LFGETGAREFPLLGDAIPLPLFIILDCIPVGVGIFVNVLVEAVGVVGILNPDRGCSEVGVFALRFGFTIVGILTVDNGCTFIGGSVSAANCCGAAIFAGRVCLLIILSLCCWPLIVPLGRFFFFVEDDDGRCPSVLLLSFLPRGGETSPLFFIEIETFFSLFIEEGIAGTGGISSLTLVNLGCGNILGIVGTGGGGCASFKGGG